MVKGGGPAVLQVEKKGEQAHTQHSKGSLHRSRPLPPPSQNTQHHAHSPAHLDCTAQRSVCGSDERPAMMVCCESCPAAYHVECAGLPGLPACDWFCPDCAKASSLDAVERILDVRLVGSDSAAATGGGAGGRAVTALQRGAAPAGGGPGGQLRQRSARLCFASRRLPCPRKEQRLQSPPPCPLTAAAPGPRPRCRCRWRRPPRRRPLQAAGRSGQRWLGEEVLGKLPAQHSPAVCRPPRAAQLQRVSISSGLLPEGPGAHP